MSAVRVGRTINRQDREPLPFCPECRIYWLAESPDTVTCPGCGEELEHWAGPR